MTILRRVARPMLATIFFPGAWGAFKHPGPRAVKAHDTAEMIRAKLPVNLDDEALVRINAGVQLGAATLFALGKAPRLSAAVLAASLIPTTYAGHAFWKDDEPTARQANQMGFYKNLSVLGGLLLAVGDTEGQPSLAWRTRHLGQHAVQGTKHAVKAGKREAKLAAKAAKAQTKAALPG